METRDEASAGEWTANGVAALLAGIRFRPAGRAWRRSHPRVPEPAAGTPTLLRLGTLLLMLAVAGLLLFTFWGTLWRLLF